jgi:hypothetical protein
MKIWRMIDTINSNYMLGSLLSDVCVFVNISGVGPIFVFTCLVCHFMSNYMLLNL